MAQLAIDLGNCSTVITLNRTRTDGSHLLPGIGSEVHNAPWTVIVPSLVHLGETTLVGEEVTRGGLAGHAATFRDFNDHLRHPLPAVRQVGGRGVSAEDAAAAFLDALVSKVRSAVGEELDLALVCPWARDERCRRWLAGVRFRHARSVAIVDRDTAQVLGHGADVLVRGPVLVFDYGFSAVRARLVQVTWHGRDSYAPAESLAEVVTGRGLADLKLGALRRGASEPGLPPQEVEGRLFLDVAKDWVNGSELGAAIDPVEAEENARQALDTVMEEAALDGSPVEPAAVYLCGGGAALPGVRALLGNRFGDRVTVDGFGLAAGRGALAFLADSPMDDMVRGRYALRMRDPITGEYHYPTVVERFTRYPTRQPTARFVVNTFYDGQTAVDLEVFRSSDGGSSGEVLEVLFDAEGRPGFSKVGEREVFEPAMEEPLVLPVNPPGRIGERRLHLEFHVDNRKHLLVSVRDLREDKVIRRDYSLGGLA